MMRPNQTEHLLDQIARMKAYIAEREAEPVTLCCVCDKPVWPSLSLYQNWYGRKLTFGHRACLDKPTPGACGDPECHVLHADPANPIHPPKDWR